MKKLIRYFLLVLFLSSTPSEAKSVFAHPIICGGGSIDYFGVSWCNENENAIYRGGLAPNSYDNVCCYRPRILKESWMAMPIPEPPKESWCDDAWVPYEKNNPVWKQRERYCRFMGGEGVWVNEENRTWMCSKQ